MYLEHMLFIFQVLEDSGLDRYVDAKYLQHELQEATDMTREQMDSAARELLRRSSTDPGGSTPYLEHMGGYTMQEMKDYNQYSRGRDDLAPRRRGANRDGYPEDYPDDDDMMYVTTL